LIGTSFAPPELDGVLELLALFGHEPAPNGVSSDAYLPANHNPAQFLAWHFERNDCDALGSKVLVRCVCNLQHE
jgi:hypothetical protein